jgi:transposase
MSTGERRKRRLFEPEFKIGVIERLLAGESTSALSRELGIGRDQLLKWLAHFRRDGPEGVRRAGRPDKLAQAVEVDARAASRSMWAEDLAAARKRVTELECKVGQQQVELDFFRRALRQVGGARRPNDGPGVRTSTRSSRR